MKTYIFILMTLFSILLVACSPTTVQPTAISQVQAPTVTKLPPVNPTAPAITATSPAATAVPTAVQPSQLAATATTVSNTSSRLAVPAAYAAKSNPLASNASVIAEGKAEYSVSCSSCHGDNADGNGRNSGSTPKPSNLLQTVKEASDAYIFWRISEGGRMAPFNSRMSSFKNSLSENEIWQVISYLRSLK